MHTGYSLHDLLIEIFRDLMIALYRGQKIDFTYMVLSNAMITRHSV
jgi:hypothetical protein